jgi:thiol-disulfide isomerase/thioredoxin
MSAVEPQKAQGAGLGRGLKAALIAALAVGVAAVLYVIGAAVIKPNTAASGLQGAAKGSMAKLQVLAQPIAAAPVPFVDENGKTVHLTDFKGQPVVLNLWATWCAPCVKEMPTLAKLQADLGPKVKVLAVSMDKNDQTPQAKAFIASHAPLSFYQDADFAFLTGLDPRPAGFPTTVLIDRKGYERAVYAGDADWSSPDAKAAIERLAAAE